MKIRVTMLMALAALVVGCAADPMPKKVLGPNAVEATTPENAILFTADGYTATSNSNLAAGDVSPKGVSFLSSGPHNQAGIGAFGVSIANPADVDAQGINVEFFDPFKKGAGGGSGLTEDGEVLLFPKKVTIARYAASNSAVIRAEGDRIAQLVSYLKTIPEAQRDVKLAEIRTWGEAWAKAADAASAILTSGVSAVGTGLGTRSASPIIVPAPSVDAVGPPSP